LRRDQEQEWHDQPRQRQERERPLSAQPGEHTDERQRRHQSQSPASAEPEGPKQPYHQVARQPERGVA
jgi:hypothetical protein